MLSERKNFLRQGDINQGELQLLMLLPVFLPAFLPISNCCSFFLTEFSALSKIIGSFKKNNQAFWLLLNLWRTDLSTLFFQGFCFICAVGFFNSKGEIFERRKLYFFVVERYGPQKLNLHKKIFFNCNRDIKSPQKRFFP